MGRRVGLDSLPNLEGSAKVGVAFNAKHVGLVIVGKIIDTHSGTALNDEPRCRVGWFTFQEPNEYIPLGGQDDK